MKLSDFLLAHPQFDAECGQALSDICLEVLHLDRKGSLVLRIEAEKQGTRVMTKIGHTARPPAPDPEAGLWFHTQDGLSKDDPYQLTIYDNQESAEQ